MRVGPKILKEACFQKILDSGLHSRLYPWIMSSIQNGVQPNFQIGELAKRAALSIDAIRFYERRKLLPPAFRSAGRFRLYTTDDIERLRFVQRMQRLGFSLEEIKQLLAIRADKAHACVGVRRFLNTKLDGVRTKIRELQELETELQVDLGKCNRALKQQRGKTCPCPVLEEIERTNNK
jgi:MerR family Zn(II)-responsive transcriptional regulator of zntA